MKEIDRKSKDTTERVKLVNDISNQTKIAHSKLNRFMPVDLLLIIISDLIFFSQDISFDITMKQITLQKEKAAFLNFLNGHFNLIELKN